MLDIGTNSMRAGSTLRYYFSYMMFRGSAVTHGGASDAINHVMKMRKDKVGLPEKDNTSQFVVTPAANTVVPDSGLV